MADYDELGRDLRGRVGDEFRAEAEEMERLAAQAQRRRRTIADVAAEAMVRGDELVVHVPGRRFTGPVTHVGEDLVSLATAAGRVDVHTAAGGLTLQVIRRPAAVGTDRRRGPATFKARLLELEMAGIDVVVGVPALAVERFGVVVAVGSDHVVVADDAAELVVPLAAVGYVGERR